MLARSLRSRGLDFLCDIIGDGPLRDALQAKNRQVRSFLESNFARVSLSQEAVLEKLQACDIFVLASTTDATRSH